MLSIIFFCFLPDSLIQTHNAECYVKSSSILYSARSLASSIRMIRTASGCPTTSRCIPSSCSTCEDLSSFKYSTTVRTRPRFTGNDAKINKIAISCWLVSSLCFFSELVYCERIWTTAWSWSSPFCTHTRSRALRSPSFSIRPPSNRTESSLWTPFSNFLFSTER